jgi:hypothetical protein
VIESGGFPLAPDLNPIEMSFSKLKAHLRRFARPVGDLRHLSNPRCCCLSVVVRLDRGNRKMRHLHNVRLGDALRDQFFVERQQSGSAPGS